MVRADGTGTTRPYWVQPPWVKAAHSVPSGGTVVSPRTGGRETYWFLTEFWSSIVVVVQLDGTGGFTRTDGRETYWFPRRNLEFHRLDGMTGWYGLVYPY